MLRWLHGVAMFMCLHNTYHFCRVCLLSSVCSILATPPRYCVLLHERQLVQYDEGGKKRKKKQAQFPNQLLVRLREARQQGADPGSTHVLFYVCCLSAVHADGTALPDFIWGNQIPPLLPLERKSISSHMSTRFVRLFITINCCST